MMTVKPLPVLQRLVLAYDQETRGAIVVKKLCELAAVAFLFVWASCEFRLGFGSPRYLQYFVAGSLQFVGGLYCLWLVIKRWRANEGIGSTFVFASSGAPMIGLLVAMLWQVPFKEWKWADGVLLFFGVSLLRVQFVMWRRERRRELTTETKQFEQEDSL